MNAYQPFPIKEVRRCQRLRINGKTSFLHRVVLEVRYAHGYTYLDRCGRTINLITREYPEWSLRGSPDPSSAGLASLQNGCLFNFSSENYVFLLEKPKGGDGIAKSDLKIFFDQIDLLSRVVSDQLDLNEFRRIGVRTWNVFPCSSTDEAQGWIEQLGWVTFSEDFMHSLEGKIEGSSFVVLVPSIDRTFRVSVSSQEGHALVDMGPEVLTLRASKLPKRQDEYLREQMRAKRRMMANPDFSVLLDVDTFQEDPLSLDPRDFIVTSLDQIDKRLSK